MYHGGFWRPEFDRTHLAPLCAAVADAGWSIAAVEYRREPGHPGLATGDAVAALGAVPALAGHHDGRVIAMGHSAGGHLCLYAAATRPPAALAGVVALAPAADLRLVDSLDLDGGAVRDFLGAPAGERADLDPARLPDIPAGTTILHGREDTIVPVAVSRSYVERHPGTRLVEIDDCGHFALIDPSSRAWLSVIAELDSIHTARRYHS